MPDERIGQHTGEWMGTNQWNEESNHLGQKAAAGLGLGGHLLWGQAHGPQCAVYMSACQWTFPLRLGVKLARSLSQGIPWPCMGLWPPQLEHWWWLMASCFPPVPLPVGHMQSLQTQVEGIGGLWSDVDSVDCSSSISQGGVVGSSVIVVAVDQLSLWATDRAPPWVGLVASASSMTVTATLKWVLWNRLCQPGQGHFLPVGQHHGHEDLLLCKWDQQLHCLPEFHHNSCQAARLVRIWWLYLLSPML